MKIKSMLLAGVSAAAIHLIVGCGKPGGDAASSGQGNAGTTAGGPSTGGAITSIQAKLKADKDLAEVKVSDQNGAIQLDGTVKDVATKDKAEKIVMDVQKETKTQGGVLNNLQVKEN